MKRFGNNNDVFCFFCGSTAGKDRKLITGPSGNTFICDKCVAICQGILDQQEADVTPIELKDVPIRTYRLWFYIAQLSVAQVVQRGCLRRC